MRRLALAAALLASGCSWVGMTPPPDPPPAAGERLRCTSGWAPITIDAIITGAAVAVLSVRAFRDCGKRSDPAACNRQKAIEMGGIGTAGALSTASGITGLFWRKDCAALRAARRAAPAPEPLVIPAQPTEDTE